jgi:BRCA1-like protein
MQSLRRAKELDGKLLAGQTFYVTPKVPVDTKLLKNVVNACGGQVSSRLASPHLIFFFWYFLLYSYLLLGDNSATNDTYHKRES